MKLLVMGAVALVVLGHSPAHAAPEEGSLEVVITSEIWPREDHEVTITPLGSDTPVVGPQHCTHDGDCVFASLPPGDYVLTSPTVTFDVGDMPDAGGVQLFVETNSHPGPAQGTAITFSIVAGETTRLELAQAMSLPSEGTSTTAGGTLPVSGGSVTPRVGLVFMVLGALLVAIAGLRRDRHHRSASLKR